jgi:FMN-dependent NADH-azoreductase
MQVKSWQSLELKNQENTMSNVLFIKGHPATSKTSVSLQIADHFLASYKAKHPNDVVSTVDLYHENIPLIDADVLDGWNKFRAGHPNEITPAERVKLHRLDELSDQFVNSDKYIFAAPMWNLGYPPMVKAYVDGAMMVQGKTFSYTEKGPVGLLRGKGKKAVILEASGGQYEGTPMAEHTSASVYLKGMLNYVGIDEVKVITAEGMAQTPEKREAIISTANAEAVAFAAGF